MKKSTNTYNSKLSTSPAKRLKLKSTSRDMKPLTIDSNSYQDLRSQLDAANLEISDLRHQLAAHRRIQIEQGKALEKFEKDTGF